MGTSTSGEKVDTTTTTTTGHPGPGPGESNARASRREPGPVAPAAPAEPAAPAADPPSADVTDTAAETKAKRARPTGSGKAKRRR